MSAGPACARPLPGPAAVLVRLALWALVAGTLWAGVLMLAVLALGTAQAASAPGASPGTGARGTPSEVPVGAGLVLGARGRACCQSAPLLHTAVAVQVTGITATVTVRQRFRNPTRHWQQAVYLFPLPEKAAVHRLRMRVGPRTIEGVIRERHAARRLYRKAARAGRRAGLVEQQRANLFTASVANIGPGQTVQVEIAYRQVLAFADGHFALRLPLVAAPRYIPGRPLTGPPSGIGWGADTDQVPDASRITPPVVAPGTAPVNPVNITVDLRAGFPLAQVVSPSHGIRVNRAGRGHVRVSLKGPVPADRDFVLRWAPARGAAPQATVLTQHSDRGDYGLLMVVPPAPRFGERLHRHRELVLVLDTSGSMGGPSLRQAKAAVQLALGRLRPGDRFNIIQFNSVTRRLFSRPVPATAGHIARARRYVRGLQANGGTEMAPALKAALDGDGPADAVRQVVFLTDGAVGNGQALFALIHARLGNARLFTVGIGSAPNGHFMARAARAGRGTYTFIGRADAVGARMGALLSRLEHPVLTDLRVRWPGKARATPDPVPDLYLGQPVVVAARLDRLQGQVVVQGRLRGRRWHARLALAGGSTGDALGALWARRRIASLMDSLSRGADPARVRAAVLRLALAHHLISRYTSLVAVDRSALRPKGEPQKRTAVPVNLPAGWVYGKVFGGLPQTATAAPLHRAWGLAALLAGAVALLMGMLAGHRKEGA